MNITYRRILYAILAGYFILGTIYSVVTPIFEASDELWHYPMVKYLADNGLALPPQDPNAPGPWRQEGSQPPLYYILAAVLTGGIDTSDMNYVRRLNPHADIGVVRPDGNANMIVHREEAEAFPWRGTTLAVHVIRFFSLVLGLGTVLVTYALAREIFPEWPLVALGAAAINAFLPMFLFISASVNNDNLSNLLGNLLTLLIVRLVKQRGAANFRRDLRDYILLGIVTGAGLLAKLNIGFLIPLVGLALLIVSLRRRDWRPVVIGGLISGSLTVIIAGWWYLRNWELYGDPTGLNMFLQLVGRRAVYANTAQLWSERHSFSQAYWGFFGGMNVPLPEVIYLIFNILGGVGLLGAVILLLRIFLRREWSFSRWLPTLVTIIWPLVTFLSYLRWTAETPASQGRLVFGALSAISLWMIVGLLWWLPKRGQLFAIAGFSGFFALVAAILPFSVIKPTYTLPPLIAAINPENTFTAANSDGRVGLSTSEVLTMEVQPEDYVQVSLNLHIIETLTQNWSLFAHLVTPDGVIVAQRDIYPGMGKLALSDIGDGAAWENLLAIFVPATAYAPMKLNVEIGWYNLATGERMKLEDGSETLTIGSVELAPRGSDLAVPNPIRVNFGDELELVGYEISDLSPAAGDTVELTLYWRGLQKMTTDYKVFANILDPLTLTKYAASDGMPAQWNAPTTTWTPGEIITDTHTWTVDPNTLPGIYETEIGLYSEGADGTFPRLQIITPDGGMANNFLNLSRVRILSAELES